MKLTFHKNLEHHLVKNGFQVITKHPKISISSYKLRKIIVYILLLDKSVQVFYIENNSKEIRIKGCKTLNDLYRLEKLIEGITNQK